MAAQAVVFVALARGRGRTPRAAEAPVDEAPADLGVVRQVGPAASTSPSFPCRSAGGTCVGLEPGACARGAIGEPSRFACGSPALRCCLPPPRDGSSSHNHPPAPRSP